METVRDRGVTGFAASMDRRARQGRETGRRMPRNLVIATIGLLMVVGCAGKDRSQRQLQDAFRAGYRQGLLERRVQGTDIFVSGPVRHAHVGWREGLTLAEALLEAEYLAAETPRQIILHRGPHEWELTGQQLLTGEDFLLEPGDLIETRP